MAKKYLCPISQSIKNYFAKIVNSDSYIAANGGTSPSNTKTLCTAGSEDSVLKSLTAYSDDSANASLGVYLSKNSGTDKYLLGVVSVPAGTQVDILGSLSGLTKDQSGHSVLALQASTIVYVGVFSTAVSASKTIHVTGVVEDY